MKGEQDKQTYFYKRKAVFLFHCYLFVYDLFMGYSSFLFIMNYFATSLSAKPLYVLVIQ